jgi:hypothetical protein
LKGHKVSILCGKSQNTAPLAAVMKREPLVLEPTGVWGRSPHIAFSRYAALRGGDTPLLAAGFFILYHSV